MHIDYLSYYITECDKRSREPTWEELRKFKQIIWRMILQIKKAA